MATALDLLNKVLIGLRQDQIPSGTTTTSDAYQLLVLQFINEAKEEIEESWDWYALRDTVTVTLAQGTADYVLTAAADSDIDTNQRSKLLYEKSRTESTGGIAGGETTSRGFGNQPQVFDVTSSAERRLSEVSHEQMERFHFTDDDEQREPRYFSLYSDGTSLRMKVFPTPEAARTIKMRVFNPQAELAADALDTTLLVPARPVWTKALWKANEERGSEASRPSGPLQNAFIDALSIAVSREQRFDDITGRPI